MTDIVERLRFTQANGLFDAVRCGKAVSFAESADTIEQLRARIAEAVLAEREACAKVAEAERVDYAATEDPTDLSYNIACEHIAAAIRERTDGR